MLLEESGPSSSPVSAAYGPNYHLYREQSIFRFDKKLMQTHQEIAVMLHNFLDHPRLCLGPRLGMLSDYADHQGWNRRRIFFVCCGNRKARVKLDDPELYVDGRHAEQIHNSSPHCRKKCASLSPNEGWRTYLFRTMIIFCCVLPLHDVAPKVLQKCIFSRRKLQQTDNFVKN